MLQNSLPVRHKFIALDPSLTSTGVAIFSDTTLLKTYTISPRNKGEARFEEIAFALKAIIALHKPDILITETAFFGQFAKTALTLGRVRGIFEGVFYLSENSKGIVIGIAPSEGKANFKAWRGKKDKELLASKINALYPEVSFKSQDEIDAVAIGLTGIKKFCGQEALQSLFKNL